MLNTWWKKGLILACIIVLIVIFLSEMESRESGSTWNFPLSGKIVVVDPGHGGPDGGAVGEGGVTEKDVTLEIANDLKDYLQQAGALVLMTREKDKDLADEETKGLSRRKTEDLHRRAEFVKEADPDVFISVHLNAIASSRWRGAQTFFHPRVKESERLARLVQSSLRYHLENTDRYAKGLNDMYLIKTVETPSVLIEAGFLSNPTENDLLKTEPYQHKIAASIYQGILRFFTNEPAPSDT